VSADASAPQSLRVTPGGVTVSRKMISHPADLSACTKAAVSCSLVETLA
jgi:hypothetical protein